MRLAVTQPDELWDNIVEARRKRKASGGNGGGDAKSPKAKKTARHWYEKEKWELECE